MGFMDRLLGKGAAQKPGQINQVPRGTAYVMWSCLDDDDSCDDCRALDGTCWIPGLADISEPPLPSCQSHEGCRCVSIYVASTESEASDIVAFIRASGGKVTNEQMNKYHESKQAPLRDKAERQYVAATKASEANRVEKDNPNLAVALYQESIEIESQLAKTSPDEWSWRNFPYLYNRLTLILENLGHYEDALHNITQYEAMPCQDQGRESDRNAIEKRKMRLIKKLG